MRDSMASGEFAVSLSGAQQLALIDYQTLGTLLDDVEALLPRNAQTVLPYILNPNP